MNINLEDLSDDVRKTVVDDLSKSGKVDDYIQHIPDDLKDNGELLSYVLSYTGEQEESSDKLGNSGKTL